MRPPPSLSSSRLVGGAWCAWLGVSAAIASSSVALAQPVTQPEPAPWETYGLAPDAEPWPAYVAPPDDPSRYRYDGWYGRVGVGLGYVAAQVAPPEAHGHDVKGTGLCAHAALGRTLFGVPGLALGGGVGACLAPARRTTSWPDPADGMLYLVTLGVLADGHPDPESGFHVGGEWNFALASTGEPGSSRAVGPGASLWLGWDAFVAPQWSLGASIQGSAAATFQGSESDAAPEGTPATIVRIESIAVLFSVLNQ